jgi:hypothetical protein
MQINVTVDGIEAVDLNTPVVNTESSEPLTLADVIADRAVRTLAYEDIRDLRRRISDIRDEQIRAIVLPTVTEAIEAGIQKTDQWGSPVGQPTTLRDLVLKEAKELISRPADSYDRKKGTVLEKVVREAVDRTIRAELSAVLAEEKAKVVAAVQAQAAELIAEAVKKGLGR